MKAAKAHTDVDVVFVDPTCLEEEVEYGITGPCNRTKNDARKSAVTDKWF